MHSKYLIQILVNDLVNTAVKFAAGGPVILPALLCLRDALASMKCKPWSPDERYRLAALNVVTGRIASTGKVFDCSAGMEPLLTNTRARISTEGLAPIESLQFVVTHLLHYVCRRRETAPLTEPPALHTLVLIEEAQTLLQKNGENIAYYQELLLRARALGVGFVFVCQDISRIDPIILAACSNLFIFGQASADDKQTCQKVLDLSPRETSLLGELPVGEAFIRFIGHPSFPWAFHARIPDVRLT
ncbi:MAG: ATP-binding protein [Candidatus Hydrogenedentes bacterium]|nr:ATP-binding protein [Candidatus Hydrogenedentota bacterium]